MTPAPRGAGMVRRAVVLVLLTTAICALLLALAQRPEVSQGLQRLGWSIEYEARLFGAALLTALIGIGLAALLFSAPERIIREALDTLPESDVPPAAAAGLAALTGALREWRHRVNAADSSRERLELAARALTESLEAAALEIGGASDPTGTPGARKAAEYEEEALRRLAVAAHEVGEAGRRVRSVTVTLLSRVADDMTAVGEPLGPVQETLAGMGRIIEDLVATYPTLPSLKALQAALNDCGADVERARQAAGLVERELNAVRRRMGGGTVEKLSWRDLLPRDDERTREGEE